MIKANNNKKAEITFPCRWDFRLAVESASAKEAQTAVLAILRAADKNAEADFGMDSSSGRFASLRASAEVQSRKELDELCERLSTVPGFKLLF
jgi:putative lipoic acid-binding regulatory protein